MLGRFVAGGGGIPGKHDLCAVPVGQLCGAARRAAGTGQDDLALRVEDPAVRIGRSIKVGVVRANRAQRIVRTREGCIKPAADQHLVLGLDHQVAARSIDRNALGCATKCAAAQLPLRTKQVGRAALQAKSVACDDCSHDPVPQNPPAPCRRTSG